jgi:hypothetical protein
LELFETDGWPGFFLVFFRLTALIDERIPLLQYTVTCRNEGAPRVGFTRGGFSYAEGFETLLWTRRSALPHVQLLSAPAAAQEEEGLDVEGGLDVGGAVAVKADGGDGLGEDDADGNEDGAGAGSEGHGDFDAGAFGILVAAAEAEAALG